MKQVIGYAYQQVVEIVKENHMYVFMDKKDHQRVGRGVLKKVLKKPHLFVKLTHKQEQFAKVFLKFIKDNNNPNKLKKVSDNKLAFLHEEYDRRYKWVYSHYFPILSIEIYFFEYLRD